MLEGPATLGANVSVVGMLKVLQSSKVDAADATTDEAGVSFDATTRATRRKVEFHMKRFIVMKVVYYFCNLWRKVV